MYLLWSLSGQEYLLGTESGVEVFCWFLLGGWLVGGVFFASLHQQWWSLNTSQQSILTIWTNMSLVSENSFGICSENVSSLLSCFSRQLRLPVSSLDIIPMATNRASVKITLHSCLPNMWFCSLKQCFALQVQKKLDMMNEDLLSDGTSENESGFWESLKW